MKLMIMGYGRHGKDTVAELLRYEFGLSFQSSSMAAARLAVYPILKDLLGYESLEECYADRHNHRALWFELIKAYNHHDKARLARGIFAESDVYVGVRNADELLAAEKAGLFDFSVWVDANKRLAPEPAGSCTVNRHMADWVLDNNGTLEDLKTEVRQMATRFGFGMWKKARNKYDTL